MVQGDRLDHGKVRSLDEGDVFAIADGNYSSSFINSNGVTVRFEFDCFHYGASFQI